MPCCNTLLDHPVTSFFASISFTCDYFIAYIILASKSFPFFPFCLIIIFLFVFCEIQDTPNKLYTRFQVSGMLLELIWLLSRRCTCILQGEVLYRNGCSQSRGSRLRDRLHVEYVLYSTFVAIPHSCFWAHKGVIEKETVNSISYFSSVTHTWIFWAA